MGISLRGAFIISAVIHASIFAPFYNQHLTRHEIDVNNSVVVDYCILKEMTQAVAVNKDAALKSSEAPKIDIKDETVAMPQPKSLPARRLKAESRKRMDARKLKEKAAAKKADAVRAADYAVYYQLIKEKVRARLKDSYGRYNREGEVCLSFTITTNGSLLSYSIDRDRSVPDETLLNITASGIKALSPFPPLPKSFSSNKMSFNIVISFKK